MKTHKISWMVKQSTLPYINRGRTNTYRPVYYLLLLLAGIAFHMPAREKSIPKNYLSPASVAFDKYTGKLFIACQTGQKVLLLEDLNYTAKESPMLDLPCKKVLAGPNNLYAVVSNSDGKLLILDKNTLKIKKTIPVGNGAKDIQINRNETKAYVANQFSNDISVVNLSGGKEELRIDVLRQPFCMALSNDERYLFVGNFIPAERSDNVEFISASVSVIDTQTNKKIKDIPLANGSNALRSMALSGDGKYVFISHNLGRYLVPATQLEQGWMNTSGLSIIDVDNLSHSGTILLDNLKRGAAGSWGIACTTDKILVAHSGTHDFSVIDYQAFRDRLENYGKDKEELAYDLSFLTGIRQRIPVKGNGPRTIAATNDTVVIANYFTDNINLIDLSSAHNEIRNIDLTSGNIEDTYRLGEKYFNDAELCYQNWQSCNGCHPDDARVDGLNWDLQNDGLGNPKNCKSMLYADQTPPCMISGIRKNARIAIQAGFEHIQFTNVSDSIVDAVLDYVKNLKPVPSPYLVNGKLSKSAKRGKKIFEQENCMECHSGAYFTDGRKYDIGPEDPWDKHNHWDTPTLIEIWRTGPYMHDGRFSNLEDVFLKERHGVSDQLTEEQIRDLTTYVLSL